MATQPTNTLENPTTTTPTSIPVKGTSWTYTPPPVYTQPTTTPTPTTTPATQTNVGTEGLLSGGDKKKKKNLNPTYMPSDKNVSPLVSDQLNAILNQNSALMQSASTKGRQYANTRGLLNSSLGAQASQQAMIEAATPIAQANADFAIQKILQNDRLATQIMSSDMTTKQKNSALDFLLGSKNQLKSKATNLVPKNYKDVKAEYKDFGSFIMDSKARDSFKTPQEELERQGYMNPLTGKVDLRLVYKRTMNWLGGNELNSSDRKLTGEVVDKFGSWEGALRAARIWGGKNLTEKEAVDLIKQTLRG